MTQFNNTNPTAEELIEWVIDARQRTFDLIADLSDQQIMSPYLSIVNPLLWEIGQIWVKIIEIIAKISENQSEAPQITLNHPY